jgi:hypothetical protein
MRRLLCIALFLLLSACVKPANYGLYREKLPLSILVLPPINDSIEVDAPYVYLSTITRPLAEMGYYVFPVAVVDNFMKDNGLPTPYEMHGVSLSKIKEVFAADAVLYLHINDWGQKYQVLSSNTVIQVSARLVDVNSGETLWQSSASVNESSSRGNSNLVGMLISAAVTQVINTSSDRLRALAATANQRMVNNRSNGLLMGPRHPESATDPRGR